jgi:hypothetical protein
MSQQAWSVVIGTLLALVSLGNGLAISYCSPDNNAASFAGSKHNSCYIAPVLNVTSSLQSIPVQRCMSGLVSRILRVCHSPRKLLLVFQLHSDGSSEHI